MKRLDDLENEETERDIVITCVEEATVFNEQGMRMPVHPEPIGLDEAAGGRPMAAECEFAGLSSLTIACCGTIDQEGTKLTATSDQGIIRCDPVHRGLKWCGRLTTRHGESCD